MCQLPPKKPNIEKKKPKSQRDFLTPTASEKKPSKKPNWQPWLCGKLRQ